MKYDRLVRRETSLFYPEDVSAASHAVFHFEFDAKKHFEYFAQILSDSD